MVRKLKGNGTGFLAMRPIGIQEQAINCLHLLQARRHGGAFRGRAPPNENFCPPSVEECPKESNGLGSETR